VQSVALRLVCEREDELQDFLPQEYWSIAASLDAAAAGSNAGGRSGGSSAGALLPARLVEVDGQRLGQFSVTTQQQAAELQARLWQQQQGQQGQDQQQQGATQRPAVWYSVRSLVKRPVQRQPPPPLITSSLQQEAARRLGFSASRTMQVAQQLYEGANTGARACACVFACVCVCV
jgi:DNA topoisomerase-1